MTEQTYNGWTNYPTWAVGMYLDGNYTGQETYQGTIETVQLALTYADSHPNVPSVWTQEQADRFAVADHLKQFASDEMGEQGGLTGDLSGWAFDHVNWNELADAWIENVRSYAA